MQQLTPTINTKALYRFEHAALDVDSSGNSHALIVISVPTENSSGVFGGAVALAGDDGYFLADHVDFRPAGVFSVGCWFKTSTTGAYQFFSQGFAGAASKFAGWQLRIADTNKLQFLSFKNTGQAEGTDYKAITSTASVCDGNWHFAVGVWNGISLQLFLDGASANTDVAWANAPAYQAASHFRIGCYSEVGTNSFFFTGLLDDVFLENRAWSANEISAYFKGSFFQMF